MNFFVNFIKSALRATLGVAILLFAAGIPAHFVETSKEAVVAAGVDTQSAYSIAQIYLDAAKISSAELLLKADGASKDVMSRFEAIYDSHPQWIVSGGDEPFFATFYSTISDAEKASAPVAVYPILSTSDARKKLLDFLSQADLGIVKKIISMRTLNTLLIPPVYTSAGAPLEAALLTNALLAQAGDYDRLFLRDISSLLDTAKTDAAARDTFEKYCIATVAFSKRMDWTLLRSVVSNFKSLSEAYEFAKVYEAAPNEDLRASLVAGMLLIGRPADCAKYLSGANQKKWEDFAFAYRNGEGSLNFLLSQGNPIYENSFVADFIEPICGIIKARLGVFGATYPTVALALKVILSVLGGYLFIRGLIRIFICHRDTPSWHSPLALMRGMIEGVIVSVLFFLVIEPEDFKIKIAENSPTPELRFAFDKVMNTMEGEIMKFETDTATITAVGLFLALQFTVYLISLIRLSVIKRTKADASLKLKLLENEENLFDLGLYIGLAGTVVSLILLTMGVVTASLMAAYASTLFGILFTALIKIVHVRKYKRTLLIESAK